MSTCHSLLGSQEPPYPRRHLYQSSGQKQNHQNEEDSEDEDMELWEGSYKQLFEDCIKEGPDNWAHNGADSSHKGDEKGIKGPDRTKGEVMIITDMVKGERPSC